MGKNFVDTDLLDPGASEDAFEMAEADDSAAQLARQKERIQEKVSDAAEEIERLQLRQKELEQARQALRELHRKQHEYEDGKKHLIEQFNRNALQLEKQEIRLTRMLELVTATRSEFEGMLRELRDIREEQWVDADFEEELDGALALMESMRGVYHKSLARLEAQGIAHGAKVAEGDDEVGVAPWQKIGGWGFWFRAGIACSLSLGLVGTILLLLFRHFL